MKLNNRVWRFPRTTKIVDFRKNAEKWKHCSIVPSPQLILLGFFLSSFTGYTVKKTTTSN